MKAIKSVHVMINPVRYNDGAVPVIAVDTETELFTYGSMAPRVVCYSFAWSDGEDYGTATALLDKTDGAVEFRELLERACRREIVLVARMGRTISSLISARPKTGRWCRRL